jgi:hypothetical protein
MFTKKRKLDNNLTKESKKRKYNPVNKTIIIDVDNGTKRVIYDNFNIIIDKLEKELIALNL